MSKEIEKRQSTDVVAIDFAADLGAGFEEADGSAYAIPFLKILQSGSPECKKSDGAYIKGAEEGFFFNTVTHTIHEELLVIPCYYTHTYVEWGDRISGGGFKASYPASQGAELLAKCQKNEKYQDVLPNGNLLVDSRNHYLLLTYPDLSFEPALLVLSSTQIKKSRRWMTMMQNVRINGQTAPMFSQQYLLSTVAESNDKGSWFGLNVQHAGPVAQPRQYAAARDFRDSIRQGQVSVELTD